MKQRSNYLSVPQQFNLEHICRIFTKAFGQRTYQVGSSLERADYRDVDLRCILSDEEYDSLFFGKDMRLKLFNVAISEWAAARTGLNIDFQFQRQTDANEEFPGPRHFRGSPIWTMGDGEE